MPTKKPNKNGAATKTTAQAVYFLSLSLENVRCFGPKQALDLSDGMGRPARWTILLGNNGTGKTTVLQALAGFGPPGYLEWPMTEEGFSPWLRCGELGILKAILDIGNPLTAKEASYRVRPDEMVLEANAVTVKTPKINGAPNMEESPRCLGYGATRRLGSTSFSQPRSEYTTASLFSDLTELRNAEEWLLQLDYAASKHSDNGKQQARFNQVKDLLLKIMPEGEVKDIRCNAGTGTHPKAKVEFQTPYGWVPLRQLGYGYQTLIAWMVDFASRMVERYPDSPDPLAEPAVVLVDEIDLHLHPTWQRKLIGYLTERFPNTQFIATAHSPLIVQAATGANLAVLRREGDHVIIDQSFKGIRNWSIDQLLTSDLFGIESPWPPELDGLLTRRTTLMERAKLTKAERAELKQIEAKIGELPIGETAKEMQEIRDLTRKTQELLEKYHAQRS